MQIPKIYRSGIYKITNKINKKFYIGSAKNFYARGHLHKGALLKNKHYNKHLQSAVNKYGIENFQIEILATCPFTYLIKLEQWFIDNLKPHYNKRLLAHSNFGMKLSEEHKEKLRKIRKGVKLTEEHKNILIKVNTGKVYSLESRNKMSIASKGKPKSEQARINMSNSKKGKPSPRKGAITSKETKIKQSEARKRYLQNKILQNAFC